MTQEVVEEASLIDWPPLGKVISIRMYIVF